MFLFLILTLELKVDTWAELIATPDAETPPGPALPVPAPDALPLPNWPTKN